MFVCQLHMPMFVFMRLFAIPFDFVFVLVVLIMNMAVAMFNRIVGVLMHMALGEMQPHAEPHQGTGNPKCRASRFLQEEQRNR